MTHANDARSKVRNRGRELAPVPSSFYGAVVGWNKGAQDLYGYTAGEMIGQPVAIVVPEPLHEESLQFLLDTCAQPLLRKETDRKREKGILVEVSLLFSPARNSKGEIIGGSTIAPAITERKGSEDLRERLAALVESSDDAIIGKSLDGTITSWNAGAERMFGYSSSEAVGKPIQMLLPPERANEESAILAQIGKGERIDHFETVRVGQDAKRVDVSVTISPIRDRRGRIVGASKIARDIGERKRAEAVQERLAAVLESSDDAIIGESLDGTITSWNRGAEDLFGYSESEAVGKFIQMLLPPDRANEEFDILARLKNGERINHFETVRVQKDGKRINVSVTISPIRDSSGAIIGASKIARDISERKCVEEELRKAEERFGKAFRSNPLAVSISTRAEGRYLDVNDSFLKILGYKRGDVIGRTASGLSFWAQPSEREQMLKLLDDNGRVTELHTQCKTSIGELREVEVSAELIELEGLPCVLAITRDITDTLLLEAQFRQAQKMEAVGRLAAGVAHDFNNMLSVIIGYSDLSIDMIAADSPLEKHLAQIKKASERAAVLTRQLLAFSRQQVIFPRILDLNEVVENLTTMLLRMVGESISVSFRPTTPIGSIKADPGQIEQILMNLMVNARDAMPGGGEIIIETGHAELDEHYVSRHAGFHTGQHVVLTVSDTGCGMDESVKSKIFEPFFTTKGIGQGTGLGLSTVHGIVSQSQGSICVDSQPGKGTTFTIYFPRVAAKAEDLREFHEVQELPLGSETILVVDDDDAVRKVTASLLSNAGYRIVEANSAKKAMEIITESGSGIDLLLTDLVMFGQSGFKLFEQAKVRCPNLRSLFMSGYAGDLPDLQSGLISERAFLAKPFARVPLLKKVYAVLHSE
ncbi:MAG: PAS domain S-box protein [Candidatus Sulfotelmatobacter sp.]|jgi:PAS domain S-box-containing protein